MNCILLSFQFKLLNFNANNGNSATNKYAETKGKIIRNQLLVKNVAAPQESFSIIYGMAPMKMVFAGVGTPTKELV